MDRMIARLETCLVNHDPRDFEIPVRSGFHYRTPKTGLVEWMPAMRRGVDVTLKVVGYHPDNPGQRGLPTILSTLSAHCTSTGHLLGLVDGTFATALRTGAASALASRYLARPSSRVVGLIGCGAQAVTQIHALSRVFDIEEVWAYDVDELACASMAERMGSLGERVRVRKAARPREVVEACDILCTATSVEPGEGPVFEDGPCHPWLHVNAVGADFPGKFEVPETLLARALVCPDFPEQARIEGECQRLAPEQIGPSLLELAQGAIADEVRDRLTVFDSTGWALEDSVTLELLLELAKDLDIGERIMIERITADPRDPYEGLRDHAERRPHASEAC